MSVLLVFLEIQEGEGETPGGSHGGKGFILRAVEIGMSSTQVI